MASARRTSQVEEFPFLHPIVCWVLILNDGTVMNPWGTAQRRDAATLVMQGGARLYIAWPGRSRTDLFEVDEPDKLERIVLLINQGQVSDG